MSTVWTPLPGWEGILSWDGPGEELEFHVAGSGPYKHIHCVTGSGAAIGRDQVNFCIIGYETILAAL